MELGSVSSMIDASIQSVSTSGRPKWEHNETYKSAGIRSFNASGSFRLGVGVIVTPNAWD